MILESFSRHRVVVYLSALLAGCSTMRTVGAVGASAAGCPCAGMVCGVGAADTTGAACAGRGMPLTGGASNAGSAIQIASTEQTILIHTIFHQFNNLLNLIGSD